MEEKTQSHDQLQSKCHIWLWNTHPELRGLFHTNFSDFKIADRLFAALAGIRITQAQRQIILSQMKAIGLVKGTFDQELLYNGILNFFECKVGHDKLSPDQIAFKEINSKHGARFFEYRTEEEFRDIIENKVLKG